MIRVLFVDDHEMVRIGVSAYLYAQPDIEVIAEADDGKVAIDLALQHKPHIILMDLVMKEMDGIEATKKIMEEWPDAKIIIVTSFLDDEKVYPALEAGAKPQQIVGRFVHPEPKGVKALIQGGSGGGRGKLVVTRLYIFPAEPSEILHLITIGDKQSQHRDIQFCIQFVDSLRSTQQNEAM